MKLEVSLQYMNHILLLFDYLPVKNENRFNKSKSESFGKLEIFNTLLMNDDNLIFLNPKKLLFF